MKHGKRFVSLLLALTIRLQIIANASASDTNLFPRFINYPPVVPLLAAVVLSGTYPWGWYSPSRPPQAFPPRQQKRRRDIVPTPLKSYTQLQQSPA